MRYSSVYTVVGMQLTWVTFYVNAIRGGANFGVGVGASFGVGVPSFEVGSADVAARKSVV